MAKTTLSGPVASQNGFVTPTYTSATLPYFELGNMVVVSDLNTIAFGGVDQWYDQRTGLGLGTGGNVGPGPTPPTPVIPKYPVTLGYINSTGVVTDGPIKFSPDGTSYIYPSGPYLYQVELGTPWDTASALVPASYINLSSYFPAGEDVFAFAWNADGTYLNAIYGLTGMGTPCRFSVSTPFRVDTITGFEAAPSPFTASITNAAGLTFSADGMKAFTLGYSDLYQFNLTQAYNFTTASNIPTASLNLGMQLGAGSDSSYPRNVAFTSDGKIGFLFDGGSTSGTQNGKVIQFSLLTGFDLTTFVGYSNINFSSAFPGITIPYVSTSGVYLNADNTKLMVNALDVSFSPTMYNFTVTGS